MDTVIQSAVDRDMLHVLSSPPSTTELITTAAGESGLNPFKTFLDYLKLKKGVGQLRFDEYICFGLHIPGNWEPGERERFLSADAHWRIFDEVSTREWWAMTEEKWLSSLFLEKAGIPVPVTVGVIDTSTRVFPDTIKINSSETLKKF